MEMLTVCKNAWCKGTFYYTESEMTTSEDGSKSPPPQCKKCRSFNSELSGGVEWKDKEYPNEDLYNGWHKISYKVTNFRQ